QLWRAPSLPSARHSTDSLPSQRKPAAPGVHIAEPPSPTAASRKGGGRVPASHPHAIDTSPTTASRLESLGLKDEGLGDEISNRFIWISSGPGASAPGKYRWGRPREEGGDPRHDRKSLPQRSARVE